MSDVDSFMKPLAVFFFSLPGISPVMPTSGIMIFEVYQWSWLKIAVAMVLAAATSCEEAYCSFGTILPITEN